jgi:ribonucleoside-diphosphate reductase alpha chain
MAMRHKIPLQFIIDQLNKTKRFDTFAKTMARVLKGYIADGEKVLSKSHAVCPECGSELTFKEGCLTCNQCGWSKC